MLSVLCCWKPPEQKWLAYKSWSIGIETLACKSNDANRGGAPREAIDKEVPKSAWISRSGVEWIWRGFLGQGKRGMRSLLKNSHRFPEQNPHCFGWESVPESVPQNYINWVHAYGVVRQHGVLRRVLGRFWEGFWGRVLGRVLRRGPAMGFAVKRVLRRVLRRVQKVPGTPPWRVRPLRRAPQVPLCLLIPWLCSQALRPCPPPRTGFSGLRPEMGKKRKNIGFGLYQKIGKN